MDKAILERAEKCGATGVAFYSDMWYTTKYTIYLKGELTEQNVNQLTRRLCPPLFKMDRAIIFKE